METRKKLAMFYVRRKGETTDLLTGEVTPRSGWTGPLRSEKQAEREAAAWRSVGWEATVEPATAEIRREVRAWQRERKRQRESTG